MEGIFDIILSLAGSFVAIFALIPLALKFPLTILFSIILSTYIYFNKRINGLLSVFENSCYGDNSEKTIEVVQWLYSFYKPTKKELETVIKKYNNPVFYLPHIKTTELYKWINHLNDIYPVHADL